MHENPVGADDGTPVAPFNLALEKVGPDPETFEFSPNLNLFRTQVTGILRISNRKRPEFRIRRRPLDSEKPPTFSDLKVFNGLWLVYPGLDP